MSFQSYRQETAVNSECSSLEEISSEEQETDEEMSEDIIDFEDDELDELNELEVTRSISPHTSSSSHNTTNSQSVKNVNQPTRLIDLPSNLDAISRAKNIITFCRALNGGFFRNVDPNHFAVISNGQLIGIYESESKACQVIVTIKGDGMVFPISGNFKQL